MTGITEPQILVIQNYRKLIFGGAFDCGGYEVLPEWLLNPEICELLEIINDKT